MEKIVTPITPPKVLAEPESVIEVPLFFGRQSQLIWEKP
jgi:hypothetical protein